MLNDNIRYVEGHYVFHVKQARGWRVARGGIRAACISRSRARALLCICVISLILNVLATARAREREEGGREGRKLEGEGEKDRGGFI